MVLSILVILVLSKHTYCDDTTGDHLLFLQGGGNEGPYVKTGQAIEYQHTSPQYSDKILFKDNQWVITDDSVICCGYINIDNNSLIPPKTGWVDRDGSENHQMVVHVVPIITPPLVLSIKGDSLQDIAGLYNLLSFPYNGYPIYYNDEGYIRVFSYDYQWYWENKTGATVKISSSLPPSYSPAGWVGWDVEEDGNKTVVLSSTRLFCSTDHGGYFITKSHSHFCNKKPNCNNNVDENDCSVINIAGSMLISLGIVLMGVGIFLILHYSHIMDIHSPRITLPKKVNIDTTSWD